MKREEIIRNKIVSHEKFSTRARTEDEEDGRETKSIIIPSGLRYANADKMIIN